MKKIIKTILSKYDKFWTPVAIAILGLVIYAMRFIDDFIREFVPHLSAIAISLVVIAFVLLILGVAVDWSRVEYRANDAALQDVDEAKNTGKNK
jgi:uncharacterized membrane protein HdeD (DUF308 family)